MGTPIQGYLEIVIIVISGQLTDQFHARPTQAVFLAVCSRTGHFRFSGFTVGNDSSPTYHHSVRRDAISVPGFLALQYLLSLHANVPQVIGLLIQLSTGNYDSFIAIAEVGC